MDVVNLKISKLGGLTKIKQARDLCVSMGIAMTLRIGVVTSLSAAIAHPAKHTHRVFTTTDFNSYVTVKMPTARAAPCKWAHERVDFSWPGHPAEVGCVRQTRGRSHESAPACSFLVRFSAQARPDTAPKVEVPVWCGAVAIFCTPEKAIRRRNGQYALLHSQIGLEPVVGFALPST
jgi:hypothetical protein